MIGNAQTRTGTSQVIDRWTVRLCLQLMQGESFVDLAMTNAFRDKLRAKHLLLYLLLSRNPDECRNAD